MNQYYHEVTVGFNWWYVAVPILMLLFVAMGSARYHIESETGRIKRREKGYVLMLKSLAYVADIFLLFLIVMESFSGVLQFCMNSLAPEDSAFWAVIISVIIMAMFACICYSLFVLCINFGSWAKLGYLTEIRKERQIEESKKRERLLKYGIDTGLTIYPQNK